MLNIKIRVRNLIIKYGTANPRLLAADLGISVIETDLPKHIRGFFVKVLRRGCIILNQALPEPGKRIVLCHEIGHSRLHAGYGWRIQPDCTFFVSCRCEHEANKFAIYLLSHSSDIDADITAQLLDERQPNPREVHAILGRLID